MNEINPQVKSLSMKRILARLTALESAYASNMNIVV